MAWSAGRTQAIRASGHSTPGLDKLQEVEKWDFFLPQRKAFVCVFKATERHAGERMIGLGSAEINISKMMEKNLIDMSTESKQRARWKRKCVFLALNCQK